MNERRSSSPTEITTGDPPVRLLLLDDDPASLFLRAIILRQHGYEVVTAASVDEAIAAFPDIDIAVLDYHLGAGQFGTDVAVTLRESRPEVPIIILSATLEHYFGGVEDMHLLKGFSSNEDLIGALKSLDAKRRGEPVVVDSREFFYSRIALAIGSDVLIQILDGEGNWIYCNDSVAEFLGHERAWFAGRNLFQEMSGLARSWRGVIADVASIRQTYIDRSRRSLFDHASFTESQDAWSVIAFPMTLHDGRGGVVLTARILGQTAAFPA